MRTTIEADFFPPAVEEIKDTPPALIVDNDPDAAHSVETSLNQTSGSSPFEVGDTKASSKSAEF